MESGQLKSGSIDILNLPTIFYQISNSPTTEYEMTLLPGHFSENITLKLHVTFCRTSRIISPNLCHALFSMSRVKSGEFCHVHIGFFFSRFANFYSVDEKPSNYANTRLRNRVP